jgi:CDP-paratose 2-epimerase
MNILITGGAGFIGSSLSIYLKDKYPHYSITAFDNLKRRGSELNISDLREKGIVFVHGDIRNPEDMNSLDDIDLMIEASAEPSVMSGLTNEPTYIIKNNLHGAINCFNLCLKHKASLIFLSTSRVYPIDRIENASYVEEPRRFSFTNEQKEKGISINGISEELDLKGARSFYGATKLAAELFIQEYSAFYGMKSAITRFGVVAGPRQMGKTDQGIATFWMAKHFWKQPLKYIGYGGTGKQVRDILHIDDLMDLIDFQIHNIDIFNGKIYNAGGGAQRSISLLEMTEICTQITGNTISISSEEQNRPGDVRIYVSDNTRIINETGWKPKRDIELIFTDIFNWIKQDDEKLKPILF